MTQPINDLFCGESYSWHLLPHFIHERQVYHNAGSVFRGQVKTVLTRHKKRDMEVFFEYILS